jgi:diguanylate cyclase (GGDEF)-like protein
MIDLPDRTQFYRHLQQVMVSVRERDKRAALLLIDLDRFRDVNATFGHQRGDMLLERVSARIRDAVRKSDMVAYLGGDEFAVLLLLNVEDEANVTRVANRILDVLEPSFVMNEHVIDVGGSIGIAIYTPQDQEVHDLLRRAEVAMCTAKRAKSGYAFYSADQDHYSPERFALRAELRQAIKNDQLVLHYQPVINLVTGEVTQAEALIRWQHSQHGLLPPDRFIPLAEQTGLINALSSWVLNAALRQCWLWQQIQIELRISANLSMGNLYDPHLPDRLTEMLQSWGLSQNFLEVEITESTIAADPKRALQILSRLRDMGVRIAVDDFGTGHSSLAYLKRLPIHTIKIDRSFIKDLHVDENDAAIVRSTIELGHTLGFTVVAEGVENKETYELLSTLGCDLAQGNYFSWPLPADDLVHWLRESSSPVKQ